MVGEKQDKEKFMAEVFLNFYNKHSIEKYKIKRNGIQGKINEPDIICTKNLNIEIVGIHYSTKIKKEEEFKIKQQDLIFKETGKVLCNSRLIKGPDNIACNFCLEHIYKKNEKLVNGGYDYEGKIILLVYVGGTALTYVKNYSTFFESYDFDGIVFNEIWLIGPRVFISKNVGPVSDIDFNGAIFDEEYVICRIFSK